MAEVFLPNIESKEEFKAVVTLLYRVCKHSLLLPCHLKETEEVVHKNLRMGIGVTGYLTATEEQRSWCKEVYEYLRQYDKEYSEKIGVNTSIKITTVKPAGTLSLHPGVSSGGHPAFAPYYIRRMRVATESPLVDMAKKNGIHVEAALHIDGTEDRRTMVLSFPCKSPEHSIFAKDMSAIDQMNTVRRLQTEWSDNAVSVTVYYRKEELEDIKEWLKENYSSSVKTMSFMLHNDHGFKQAPLEEITKEDYEKMLLNYKPITSISIKEDDISSDQIGCESGVCPIK